MHLDGFQIFGLMLLALLLLSALVSHVKTRR